MSDPNRNNINTQLNTELTPQQVQSLQQVRTQYLFLANIIQQLLDFIYITFGSLLRYYQTPWKEQVT